MLRPRIIPCLLVRNGGLVKTVRFRDGKYVGDPINAVRIFNEKEVDELMVLDIDASGRGAEPDYAMIRKLAAECRMPLTYGGGIRAAEQVEKLVELGVEKAAISTSAILNPALVQESSRRVGSQSVAVVLDVKRTGLLRRHEVMTLNGERPAGVDPVDCAVRMAALGAGEIVVNSIDRDGEMGGYDVDMVERVYKAVRVPVTALGGAGDLKDMSLLLGRCPGIGLAAGSMFVFKGRYRAVLISYPSEQDKLALVNGQQRGVQTDEQ